MTSLSFSAFSDYVTTSLDVIFGANDVTTTVVVPIIDDSIGELDEVFYGTLTNVGNSNVNITEDQSQITEGQAEIHIIDDDGKYEKANVTHSN